jgi:cytochrome b561
MRTLPLLILIVLLHATTAFAAKRAGSPPWGCMPISACNQATCVTLFALPLTGFLLRNAGNDKDTFLLQGFNGSTSNARLFPTLEGAQDHLKASGTQNSVSIILIRNNRVSDSHGFDVHSVHQSEAGEPLIGQDKLLVSCSSVRD